MKIKCPNCEKVVKAKIIRTWRKKSKERSTRPVYFSDKDGDDIEARFPLVTVTRNYKKIQIFEHKRGLIRKHRCLGSGKKVVRNSKFVQD